MQTYNFCYQQNQFFGECVPCTADVFNQCVDDAKVAWKISTRQAVDRAIAQGASLDVFAQTDDFKRFCLKKTTEKTFGTLTLQQQLT